MAGPERAVRYNRVWQYLKGCGLKIKYKYKSLVSPKYIKNYEFYINLIIIGQAYSLSLEDLTKTMNIVLPWLCNSMLC
jgi:hypothetical protein